MCAGGVYLYFTALGPAGHTACIPDQLPLDKT